MNIQSPVTLSTNTSHIRDFDTNLIKEQYISETAVNVDRYLENLSHIQLFHCNDTGYRFYYPFNIFGDGKFYNDLDANNKWYYQNQRWEHNIAASVINNNEKVLEVGAGDGWFMKQLRKQGVEEITGLELNAAAIEKIKEAGFKAFCETIQSYANSHPHEYDVVCYFQVLEHITKVKSFIDASLKALKKGGHLIISVPNNNPYIFQYDADHTLNLPPHHAGLWNIPVFEKLQHYYPVKLIQSFTEPLTEYKQWYKAFIKHQKENNSSIAFWLSLIPWPVFKMYLKLNHKKIAGRNILVIFEKI
jgi:2-polyprenyl-3-methyl-5-hydroxy-6-metoxy-1,4-benzoquinol methylase